MRVVRRARRALRRRSPQLNDALVQVRTLLAGWWGRFGRRGTAGLTGLIGLVLLALGPAGLAVAWRDQSQQQERERSAHRVGEAVRDGPISFIVHEVRCGATDEATHGRLCEITLGARNEGQDEVAVPDRAQTLHVSEGARHQPTTNGSGQLGALAPQQAATTVIRFDLPLAATITHLELRADTYARGVPVAVDNPYPLLPPD